MQHKRTNLKSTLKISLVICTQWKCDEIAIFMFKHFKHLHTEEGREFLNFLKRFKLSLICLHLIALWYFIIYKQTCHLVISWKCNNHGNKLLIRLLVTLPPKYENLVIWSLLLGYSLIQWKLPIRSWHIS